MIIIIIIIINSRAGSQSQTCLATKQCPFFGITLPSGDKTVAGFQASLCCTSFLLSLMWLFVTLNTWTTWSDTLRMTLSGVQMANSLSGQCQRQRSLTR